MDKKNILVIVILGAIGLCGCNPNQPLNKFKEKYSAELEKCIGARGSINYNYFMPSTARYGEEYRNIGIIEVTMKKKEKNLKVQYEYNKTTKIFSEMPSYVEIDGEPSSIFLYGLFCM
jgi:hypothetical protein